MNPDFTNANYMRAIDTGTLRHVTIVLSFSPCALQHLYIFTNIHDHILIGTSAAMVESNLFHPFILLVMFCCYDLRYAAAPGPGSNN